MSTPTRSVDTRSLDTRAIVAPKTKRRRRGDARVALFFIAPAALGFLAFYLIPSLRGIWFSFTDQNLIGGGSSSASRTTPGC